MSSRQGNPLVTFTDQLVDFARGERRGIRNPFVMVPVKPAVERQVTRRLESWAGHGDTGNLREYDDVVDTDAHPVTVTAVRLDHLLPATPVFETVTDLGPLDGVRPESVEGTLNRNLAPELIDRLIDEYLIGDEGVANEQASVLLLLNLGSLYPFTRASELLDELDRKQVNTTVGIPFPGSVIGGRLSFFNEDARHYYPAHRVEDQIQEGYLTDV